jgi:hypothetical protein
MTSPHPERGAIIVCEHVEKTPWGFVSLWCAYRETNLTLYGYGETERAAIVDLIQQERDRGES